MRKSVGLLLSFLMLLLTAVPAAAAETPALFGTVTDRNGQPVAGAEVEVYGLGEGLVGVLYTGSNGTFALTSYEGNPLLWQIRVWAKGYRTYESGWFDLMQQKYQTVRLEALNGGLQVTVRDDTGAPLEGTVNLIGPGGRLMGQFNLVQGQFSRDGLEPGNYRLVISAPGLAPQAHDLTVTPNLTATAAITLGDAGFTVTGEVREAGDSDPVNGALVELLRADLTQVTATTTTQDGRFFLAAPNEQPGSYQVRVTKEGFRSTLTDAFAVTAGQGYDLSGANAVMLNALTASLDGEVLDEDGDPLEDVDVVLLLQGYGEVDRDETDDDGRFSFNDLKAGTEYKYTVLPLHESLTFEPEWTVLTAGSTNHMTLKGQDLDGTPSGEGNISGIVTTVGGQPIRNAKVELWLGDEDVDSVKTDRSGAFLFEDVEATWEDSTDPKGNPEVSQPYTIRVTASGYFDTRDFTTAGAPAVQLHVKDGTTTNLRVVMRPEEADLQGRVVDGADGQPVASARVSLVIGHGKTLNTTTDAAGWYKFGSVPVELGQSYFLRVEAAGYLSLTEFDVTDAATAGAPLPTANLSEDKTTFTGLVLGSTGEPQAGATVILRGPNGEELGQSVSDATGYYRITTKVPRKDQLTLTATKDGWTTAMVNLTEPPAAGSTFQRNLAILPNTGTLEGQVMDETGKGVLIAWVDLLEEGKGVVATVRTDLNGRYQFKDVDLSDSGWFSVRVRMPGSTFGGSLTHRTEVVPLIRLVPGEVTITDLLVKTPHY